MGQGHTCGAASLPARVNATVDCFIDVVTTVKDKNIEKYLCLDQISKISDPSISLRVSVNTLQRTDVQSREVLAGRSLFQGLQRKKSAAEYFAKSYDVLFCSSSTGRI